MEAVSDPAVRETWVMKSAQVGWTEILGNVVGYHMHLQPCPILMIQPTVEMGQAWSKDRLDPMLRDTPVLRGRVKDIRGRGAERGNTVLHKTFPGGHLTVAGANSPAGLASRPIRLLLFDEVDRFPASAGEEGDPITLAKKRTAAFWNRRILGGSTPTTAASRIAKAFAAGDQRRFFIPCPQCGEFDYLRWESVTWQNDDPETARLLCPHCGSLITDLERIDAMAAGEWRATAPFNGVASFHVWEAYNTMVTLVELVRAHIEQSATPETYRTWVNTSLGEPYEDTGETPSWKVVANLRLPLKRGELPAAARVLTCGVDVQKARLVYGVRAWGPNLESWLVEEGEFWGETDQAFVWGQLAQLLSKTWDGLPLACMFVDSGYRPGEKWKRPEHVVYQFCRRFPDRVWATKGRDQIDKPLRPSRIDIAIDGAVIKNGLELWNINTDFFKSWVHARLAWPVDQPGGWHLNEQTSDDYCKQIVSEAKVQDGVRMVWKKLQDENHFLDVEVLNVAAAYRLNLHIAMPEQRVGPIGSGAPMRRRIISKGVQH